MFMKKWMTVAFASIFAVTLSMPVFAQAQSTPSNQTAAAKKADKDAKKAAAKKKKEEQQAAAKKAKADKASKSQPAQK
jgi:hypothetical protein